MRARPRDVPWLPPADGPGDAPLGYGGPLSPALLLRAYADGVFPWFSPGDPVLWWSPDPRGVIPVGGLHVSRRLARTLRTGGWSVTFDTCFEAVMRACGENRPEGTWVGPEMLTGYIGLHQEGHAHSVEVWHGGELVGGTYGVAVGSLFAAESMFHRRTDASKVALAALNDRLVARGYTLWDVQMVTDHTGSMGAVEIPRRDYLRLLKAAVGRADVRFEG